MASSPTNPTVDEGDYRRFRQELDTFLRVPSISTDPERAGDVRRCAGWVAGQVESLDGFRVEIIDTAGHPVVVGERMVSDELPTLLTYRPNTCLLYTSPSPRDRTRSRMPSSA